jgi:hypothetical protein
MRLFFLLLCLAAPLPVLAWEFTPDPICTLRNTAPEAETVITHDPGLGLYTLPVTRSAGPWDASATFAMTFSGGRTLTIGTDRHVIDGPRLTVQDSGFGNVLNGLEFNQSATAFTGGQAVTLPLAGAAEPVRAFRACTETPPAGV